MPEFISPALSRRLVTVHQPISQICRTVKTVQSCNLCRRSSPLHWASFPTYGSSTAPKARAFHFEALRYKIFRLASGSGTDRILILVPDRPVQARRGTAPLFYRPVVESSIGIASLPHLSAVRFQNNWWVIRDLSAHPCPSD